MKFEYQGFIVVICIWSEFDLLVSMVILGAFGELVSKWPVTRKQLTVEWNGVKLGVRDSCVM